MATIAVAVITPMPGMAATRGEVGAARLIFAAIAAREDRQQAREQSTMVAANASYNIKSMSDEEIAARTQQVCRELRDSGFDLFGDEDSEQQG